MSGGGVRRWLLVGVALAVTGALVAGCGVRPSGVITGNPAPSGPAEGAELYLLAAGELTPVLRPTGKVPSPTEALTLLAAGPSPEERAQGLGSEVPSAATAVSVASGTPATEITVTLDMDVSALSGTAIEQITCTAEVAVFPDYSPPGQVSVTVTGGGHTREPQTCFPFR
ncbi:hypothetical protein SAMN05216266_11188 [Amycolatopsis marina]|uniref:Sporulation and spore germination n=1 Tax=Amycolatopsis marina TaxID=490629 RepID=A0A1I1AZ24_9PSEU|nr:hypothetical protein [Amycolatopsis marina]SFB43349.1 hypothetical protein SAMN05216266_11188 [Amycolatopsis marina]